MKRKQLPIFLAFCLILSTFAMASKTEAASSISVKLVNYLGNQSTVNFSTAGTFKLANSNTRISGADRFEVASNVAGQGWTRADNVIVVNSNAFADALAAAPLAYKYNAPILLTEPDSLNSTTATKIKDLGATKAYIVGGTASVSDNVASSLQNLTGNAVERIAGKDRFEVAKNAATELGPTSSAVVANGELFTDALAIAPYAAKNGIPILLTDTNDLPGSTKDALAGKTNTLVIGGTGSVSNSVYGQLQNLTGSTKRIAGADRYEVSANILNDPSLGLNPDTVFLSSGETFADALTGSVLAAKQNAPLLLTDGTQLPTIIKQTLVNAKTSIVNVLGGTGSVSTTVENALPNQYYLQPGTTYSAELVNGDLNLYKGTDLVKDFGKTPFTVMSDYSTNNRLTILSGTQHTYLGTMEFENEGSDVRPINQNIPFEEYIKGVVPREMPASWNVEALKAQAVAARTFSIDDLGKVVPDGQSYQVYGGYAPDAYTDKISSLVDATKGQVLRDSSGKLITAFFTSSNGGMTLSNTNTYGSALVSYLTTKPDPYDLASSSPNKSWNFTIKNTQIDMTGKDLTQPSTWWGTPEANTQIASNIKSFLSGWKDSSGNYYVNPSYEIKIVSIPALSFTTSFTATTEIMGNITVNYYLRDKSTGNFVMDNGQIKQNTLTIQRRAYDIRSMLGTDYMKSPYIKSVQQTSDSLVVTGGGWGHGLGMSQYGANVMASSSYNFTYDKILKFYYPGAILGN
ncbi:MAG: cell wall-binding repeat-containing protein [Bacillota bacterium]|nr:cell wall-binding repeat-containing protein [Bacillota bacterium]